MSLTLTYNDDVLLNSIKVEQTDNGKYYKYANTQSLYLTKDVLYEVKYKMYVAQTIAVGNDASYAAPFDLYLTSSEGGQIAFEPDDALGYVINIVTASYNTFTEKSHLISPQYSGTGSLCFAFKYGTYYISDMVVQPYSDVDHSVEEMRITVPTPSSIKRYESISLLPIYIGGNNNPVGDVSLILSEGGQAGSYTPYQIVTGSNLVISNDDNLIEGSLFIGSNLRTGVEISGYASAMIRSVGYEGFVSGTQYGNSGFMLYSGSVLSGSGDNYRGVGLELHGGYNSGSLRYRVDDSGSFLEVSGNIYATNGYFSGTISASDGYIGGWVIDSTSLYSEISGGIRMDSSVPKFSFYSGSTEFLTMKTDTKEVIIYYTSGSGLSTNTGGKGLYTQSANLTTAFMIMGNSGVADTGSAFIIDFASGMDDLPGAFVVTGSSNVIYDLISGSIFTITNPLFIDGKLEDNQGALQSNWSRTNPPYEPPPSQSYFTTNNIFSIYSGDNAGSIWDGATINYSTTAVAASNGMRYGTTYPDPENNLPRYQNVGGGWKLQDTIHSAVFANQYRGVDGGIQAAVYALKNGQGSATRQIYDPHTAILADAAPGTTAKSGVFRFGRFIVGDPWHYYASASYTGSDYEIPFYVDAQQNMNNLPNEAFGRVGINTYTPSYELHVVGAIHATGDITAFSDERKKTNVTYITRSLDIIKALQGVKYNWKKGKEGPMPNKRFVKNEDKVRIGLIAQQVEPILPEVVFTDDEGYKSINYANIVALLIEGMKEQQNEMEELKKEVDILKNK